MVAALLLVLSLVFMSPGLLPGRVAVPTDNILVFIPWHSSYPDAAPLLEGQDVLLQQLPWRHWAQNEFIAGRFPLWAPDPLGGYPLFASSQPAVLHPLNLLWVLLPIGEAFGLIMALRIWLAGLGMWGFLRAMRLHWSAALLGALGFMFSASLIAWLPWGITNILLLFPWFAWAAYAWLAEKRRGAVVALALLMGWGVFGGHPESLSIVGICTAIWAAGLMLSSSPRRWPAQALGLVVGVLTGAVMGAVQLFPFFEALGLSRAVAWRQAAFDLYRLHLDAGMMMDWVLPRWWGQIMDGVLGGQNIFTEGNNYTGLVAPVGVVMAVVAAARRRLNLRLVLPWVVVVLFGWVVAYDDALGNLPRSLPGFAESVNTRWIAGMGFGLLVIGAFGWDALARWIESMSAHAAEERRARWAAIAGCVLLALGAGLMAAHALGIVPRPDLGPQESGWYSPTDSYRFYWAVWAVGVALAIVGAIVAWAATPRASKAPAGGAKWRRWVWAALPLVIASVLVADLWRLLFTYNLSGPADRYYPETSFIQQVKALVPSPERILIEDEVMPANTALVYGIRDWRAQDPMFSDRAYRAARLLSGEYKRNIWTEYNMFLPNVNLQVAPLFGMRYYIFPAYMDPNSPDKSGEGAPQFRRLALKDGAGLWEAEGVPGFAYLSDNVAVAANEDEAARWISELTWEQIRAYPAIVESPAAPVAGVKRPGDGSSPGRVETTLYEPGHIRLKTEAVREALLVVSESDFPGWHATVDGKPVDILRTNFLSQGVVVPAGGHTVELKYEPESFTYGIAFTLVGTLALAGLVVWAFLRRVPRAGL